MKTKKGPRTKKTDPFLQDKVSGEYDSPPPQTKEEPRNLAAMLSRISKREKTGWVEQWVPPWLKGEKVPAFDYYFFEDKLAVDAFGVDKTEIDYLSSAYTPQEQEEMARKQALCSENGVVYLYLSPEDNPDLVQLAAKLGKTKFGRKEANAL